MAPNQLVRSAENYAPWSRSKHPVPACFFAAIAYCAELRGLSSSFSKIWWGHRFFDDRARLKDVNSYQPVSLTGIQGTNNPYADLNSSLVFHELKSLYPVTIYAEKLFDISSYVSRLLESLHQETACVIPYPMSRMHALGGAGPLQAHFVIALQVENEEVRLIDQSGLDGISLLTDVKSLATALEWFVAKYGYLAWYSIDANEDWKESQQSPPLGRFTEAIDAYFGKDREVLLGFLESARWLSGIGREQDLPTSSLWKIEQCRRSEALFIQAHQLSDLQVLVPDLTDLATRWQRLYWKAIFNSQKRAVPKNSLVPDIEDLLNREEKYFSQLQRMVKARTSALPAKGK
ncbi:hypothetical protein G6K86_30425 [Agrobacterium rhizogenes]|nr:hypothetical protein [Rhizobium rhizogenes]